MKYTIAKKIVKNADWNNSFSKNSISLGEICPYDLLVFHPEDLELWGFGGLDFVSGNCLMSKAPYTTVYSKEWNFQEMELESMSITEVNTKYANWHFLSVNGGRSLLAAMNTEDKFLEETILIGLGLINKRFYPSPKYHLIIVADEPAIAIEV